MRRKPQSPMKSAIVRVLVCVLIGAFATIAVAWTASLTVVVGVGTASRPSGIGEGWSYWVGREWASLRIVRFPAYFELKEPLKSDYMAVRQREIPSWSGVHQPPTKGDGTIVEIARGWPALALRTEIKIVVPHMPNAGRHVRNGWVVGAASNPSSEETIIPYQPIWSGFVIDTTVFGLVAFACLFGIGMVRRATRRRSGRCVNCGYDLRGSGIACPECGEEVGSGTGGVDAAR